MLHQMKQVGCCIEFLPSRSHRCKFYPHDRKHVSRRLWRRSSYVFRKRRGGNDIVGIAAGRGPRVGDGEIQLLAW